MSKKVHTRVTHCTIILLAVIKGRHVERRNGSVNLQGYFGKHGPVSVGQAGGRWSSGTKGDVWMNGGNWQSVAASDKIRLF